MMMWPLPDDGSFSGPARRFPATDDPDVRLTYEVADRILAEDRMHCQRVTVSVQNRVVLLAGVVDTPAMKQAVGDATRDVSGVADVCNALRVVKTGESGPGDDVTGDERFEAIIAASLAEDPSWSGQRAEPIGRAAVIAWTILVVAGWGLMSVLVAQFGWAGAAVSCVAAGLVVKLARRRRRGRRAVASSAKR